MIKLVRRGQRRAGRQEPNWIVQSSHDAIVGVTREGVITTWNPAAARLYGYAPQEIIGRSVEVLYPTARRGEAQEVLRRILGGEEIGQYLTDRVKKDGTIIGVSLTASPIVGPAGAIVGVATMSRRFTELQDARERLEVRVGKERLDAEEARKRFEEGVDQERIDAKDAQDRYEEGVGKERIDAKDAQDRYEEGVGQDRIDAKDAQDRYEERVGKERVDAKDAQDRYEERVGKERVETRDAQDRYEAGVGEERIDAKDAQDRYEERVDKERVETRDAQ